MQGSEKSQGAQRTLQISGLTFSLMQQIAVLEAAC
jgi:hypothetical protein